MKLLLSLFALVLLSCNASDSNSEDEVNTPLSSSSNRLSSSSQLIRSSSSSFQLNSDYNGMWLSVDLQHALEINTLNKSITGIDFVAGGATDSINGSYSLYSPDSFTVIKNSCSRYLSYTGESLEYSCNFTLINARTGYKLKLVDDTLIIAGGTQTDKFLKVTDYKDIEEFASPYTTDSIVHYWSFIGPNQNYGDLIINADGTYSMHLYKDKKGQIEINSFINAQGATVWRATGKWTKEKYGINTSETKCNLYEFDAVLKQEVNIGNCSEVPFMDFNGKLGLLMYPEFMYIFNNGYAIELIKLD